MSRTGELIWVTRLLRNQRGYRHPNAARHFDCLSPSMWMAVHNCFGMSSIEAKLTSVVRGSRFLRFQKEILPRKKVIEILQVRGQWYVHSSRRYAIRWRMAEHEPCKKLNTIAKMDPLMRYSAMPLEFTSKNQAISGCRRRVRRPIVAYHGGLGLRNDGRSRRSRHPSYDGGLG